MKWNFVLYDKKSAITKDRFNNPEFANEYSVKHSKMSIKFGNKVADLLLNKKCSAGRILDTGCGSGLTLIQLAKKFPFCDCYGIDLSDSLLEAANEAIQKEKLTARVKFLKANVLDIPFPNRYFDVVLNINVLHLVDEPIQMLNEIERVLKPDGFFFLTDLRRNILGILEKEIKSAFTVEEVKEIISKSDFPLGNFSSDLIWWKYRNI